tara:strand:- start:21 stop:284 length:264 start_codon:yes stop_codon:yes gene_type:complete
MFLSVSTDALYGESVVAGFFYCIVCNALDPSNIRRTTMAAQSAVCKACSSSDDIVGARDVSARIWAAKTSFGAKSIRAPILNYIHRI